MFIFLARDYCNGCINATICRTPSGNYNFQFVKLFIDGSNNPCELEYLNGTQVLMEGRCTELFPNFNYSMHCPICQDVYHINFMILIPNDIENCSNLGKTTYIPSCILLSTYVHVCLVSIKNVHLIILHLLV